MKFFAFALAAASLVAAEEFTVIVGKDEAGAVANVFTPSQVTAKIGDIVHFQFAAKNHTVTQSSFAEPCTQQFNTLTQIKGIDSGFQFSGEGAPEIPQYSVEVLQEKGPIWLFCARAPHCNAGMVFAINAPTEGERTFETFLAKAATANHPEYGTTADFTPPPPPAGAAPPPAEQDQAPITPPGQVTDPSLDPAAPPANVAVPVISVLTPQPSSIAANNAADPGAANVASSAFSTRSISAGMAASFVGLLAAAML